MLRNGYGEDRPSGDTSSTAHAEHAEPGVLRLRRLDRGELSLLCRDELVNVLGDIGRLVNQSAGYEVDVLGALEALSHSGVAPDAVPHQTLRDAAGISERDARRASRIAAKARRHEAVLGALSDGDINPAQAEAICDARVPDPVRAELVAAASGEDTDATRRRVRDAEARHSSESSAERFKRQRAARQAGWGRDHEGMLKLWARFDPETGARVEAALESLRRALWQHDKTQGSGRRTPAQRDADTLAFALAGVTLTDEDAQIVADLLARSRRHDLSPELPVESSPGLPTQPNPGPPAETTAGPRAEATAGLATDDKPALPTQPNPGPPAEATAGPRAETTAGLAGDNSPGLPTQPNPGPPAEATAGPRAEATAGLAADNSPGLPTQPNPGPPAEATAGPRAEATAELAADNSPGLPTQPNPGPPAETTAELAADNSPGLPTQPSPGLCAEVALPRLPPAQISVVIGLDALRGLTDEAGLTDAGTELAPEIVRRLACDGELIPITLGGPGGPADIGRVRRTVPLRLRRLLIARDKHCRWPGCAMPPSRCDAHHIIHWAANGPTDLANLVLLCHRHHQHLHEYGYLLIPQPDGTWVPTRQPEQQSPTPHSTCQPQAP